MLESTSHFHHKQSFVRSDNKLMQTEGQESGSTIWRWDTVVWRGSHSFPHLFGLLMGYPLGLQGGLYSTFYNVTYTLPQKRTHILFSHRVVLPQMACFLGGAHVPGDGENWKPPGCDLWSRVVAVWNQYDNILELSRMGSLQCGRTRQMEMGRSWNCPTPVVKWGLWDRPTLHALREGPVQEPGG